VRNDLVRALFEASEPAEIAHGDAVVFGHGAGKQWVEQQLRAPLPLFRAAGGRFLIALAGVVVTLQQMPGQAGAIHHVQLVILRKAGLLDTLGDAPAATEFHGPHGNHRTTRQVDRAVGLVDDRAVDTTPGELKRQT
jgi:hypothetical protein